MLSVVEHVSVQMDILHSRFTIRLLFLLKFQRPFFRRFICDIIFAHKFRFKSVISQSRIVNGNGKRIPLNTTEVTGPMTCIKSSSSLPVEKYIFIR